MPTIPGLFHCPLLEARKLMPELCPVFDRAPLQYDPRVYIADVKIHMLKPGMWPCIPNWHCDFVPRIDGKERHDLVTPDEKMYLWLSGEPLTEFRWGIAPEHTWLEFDQTDEHRGRPSEIDTWRTFIRLAPVDLVAKAGVGQVPAHPEMWIRRHAQVYLDASNFRW